MTKKGCDLGASKTVAVVLFVICVTLQKPSSILGLNILLLLLKVLKGPQRLSASACVMVDLSHLKLVRSSLPRYIISSSPPCLTSSRPSSPPRQQLQPHFRFCRKARVPNIA